MTPEEELQQTSKVLDRAIDLFDRGEREDCRKLLTEVQSTLKKYIETTKLRAAHE